MRLRNLNFVLSVAMALCTSVVLITSYIQVYRAATRRWPSLSLPGQNRDLILYSYFETPEARKNFEFFMRHALHGKADFIVMLNGDFQVEITALHQMHNVRVVQRENRCFDLGGFHEILTGDVELLKLYKRFIFMNASLRGPFFPPWAQHLCWSDVYWGALEDRQNGTKLVGMSFNCANGIPYPAHLQSMILAFDQQTLRDVLLPRLKCYEDMLSAIRDGETMISTWIRDSGGEVFAMEGRFVAHAGPDRRNSSAFLDWCVDSSEEHTQGVTHGNDVLHSQFYEGTTVHPFETIFAKTNRDWDERDRRVIDLLTQWAEISNYSSHDRCKYA